VFLWDIPGLPAGKAQDLSHRRRSGWRREYFGKETLRRNTGNTEPEPDRIQPASIYKAQIRPCKRGEACL
jgi:hypothetical protein